MSGDAPVGRTLADRYRIDAEVARGGMARVYRARDERLDRDVAVKILSTPYAQDPAFTAQFLAEARAAASLTHPSLVHVYDSGSDGDAHYIVMELLDRHRSLRQAVDADGPLPSADVLRIGRELLAGLAVVHDRKLVHCDVKSGNVMLGPGGVKLIDFGIARPPDEALDGDTSIGSLPFMSPEQLHGEALTPASDLFALGVVLYEALTGRMPYGGRTPEEVSAAHRRAEVQPPSAVVDRIPGRLDDAILQALRPDPAARFGSAAAMARALESAEGDLGAPAERDTDADETRVIRVGERGSASGAPSRGYVPPPAPARPPAHASDEGRRPAASPAPARSRSRPARSGRRSGLLGTFLILGAAGVAAFLVARLLLGGSIGSGSPSPSPIDSAASQAPGTVTVPQTVGLSTADAIALAQEAGLNWTVQCAEDPSRPEGIVGQEPTAGTQVPPGSRFTMFSARISDCR